MHSSISIVILPVNNNMNANNKKLIKKSLTWLMITKKLEKQLAKEEQQCIQEEQYCIQ